MKCMSKATTRYRYEQQEAERRKIEEEKLAAMTPEERSVYEDRRHKAAVNALSTLAVVNAYLGDNKYYR